MKINEKCLTEQPFEAAVDHPVSVTGETWRISSCRDEGFLRYWYR